MKLSLREKVLLTVFGMVVLFGIAGNFLVLPVIKNYTAISDTLPIKIQDKENILKSIAIYGNSAELLEEEKQKAQDLNYFWNGIDGSFIDSFIQEKASDNGISLKSVVIDVPDFVDAKEKEAVENEKKKNQDAKKAKEETASDLLLKFTEESTKVLGMTNIDDVSPQEESSTEKIGETATYEIETAEEEKPHLMFYKCSLEAFGDMDSLMNFVDSLNDEAKAIIVNDFLISKREEAASGEEAIAVNASESKMTVIFYYIEGFEY